MAAAGDAAALEELRVRYLGPQVAELTQRAALDRRAAARGARPGRASAANQVRQALEGLIERARRERSRPPSSSAGWPTTAST